MAGRVLGAITVTATAGLALLALAIPASAHTPTAKAECVADKAVVSVKLASYARSGNTIVVKDGQTELVSTSFGDNYEKSWTLPGDVAHTFTIAVKASDGDQNNFSKTLKTEACVKPTAPSSSTSASKPSTPATSESAPPSSVEVPPSVPASSEPAPTTTTTSPAGAGGGEGEATPPLAATGASPGWLLLSGLGLVGAGAVAMVVVRRKRAA
ncbi:LPXTG cell wall anchor domain-containing protein [Umezawaea sp. Da 62-37]|uniref:LPXTG cell wall anchor domain-containing protein n=1 Tax=Umezawaea sp. Da 62-37 TaxID=3075927 RepID=UPI0028F6EAFB|nr:LPXTG cell wall anchor domain-containing protein [Umezawaea sp. Da 62-37]WNV83452.1 LPXTG cell wall anchor domain-containing protein [Umezawaea sp. Da 62-37]